MIFTVEVDTKAFERISKQLSEIKSLGEKKAIKRLASLGDEIKVIEQQLIDQEVTFEGTLRNSIGKQVDKNKIAVLIGPNIGDNAGNIEPVILNAIFHGAGPRWIPDSQMGKLENWAAMKLGDRSAADWVRLSIATKGTSTWQMQQHGRPGFPFSDYTVKRSSFKRALDSTAEYIAYDVVEIIENV